MIYVHKWQKILNIIVNYQSSFLTLTFLKFKFLLSIIHDKQANSFHSFLSPRSCFIFLISFPSHLNCFSHFSICFLLCLFLYFTYQFLFLSVLTSFSPYFLCSLLSLLPFVHLLSLLLPLFLCSLSLLLSICQVSSVMSCCFFWLFSVILRFLFPMFTWRLLLDDSGLPPSLPLLPIHLYISSITSNHIQHKTWPIFKKVKCVYINTSMFFKKIKNLALNRAACWGRFPETGSPLRENTKWSQQVH